MPSKNIQTNASGITMMCHGFVRSLILVLLCLETVSFGIISNTDGYVFISGKSQTAFPGKKIKYDSRVHDFMFDNFGLGGVLQKGHTCKLKMLLQTKNFTCKLKMLLQIKYRTCKLKIVHAN